jgi:DNA-binding CsgD family transcriptional regulator
MAGEVPGSAFIGRAAELSRLDGVLGQAERGSPRVVLVAGDAGVGKTRLLLALADRARRRGMRVLMGACVELGDIGLPYLPVVDALRELADDPEESSLLAGAATTAPGLGRLLPGIERAGPTGGDVDQLQVLDAVRAVLVGLSERSPVLLVLEDLHWADRATRDLVAFLARTLRSGRVTLVVSYRSDDLHRRHPLRPLLAELVRLPTVERLELAPFTRTELAEQLEAIAGAPMRAEQVAGIYDRSEGNPFYAEQLLAAGADDTGSELPATLAEVLLARVQGLSEPARHVLAVAAVAGRRVPHQLLAEVAGEPEADLERGLHEAVGAGVLTSEAATGSYAFRHALLQEAVYGDLLPGEQARLHAAYAHRLAEDPGGAAAELAHHCLASHDVAGALAASVRAAEEAEAVLAPAEALSHLSNALRLWEVVPEPAAVAGVGRVELALRAARAASTAGDHQRAAGLAQDAVGSAEAGGDPAQAARAYERLGLYLFDDGRIEEALEARARAVGLVPDRPPSRLRARVTAAIAQALVNARRREDARRWCEEALEAARGAGSAADEADVLISMGMVEQYTDPARARSLFAAARAQAAGAGDLEIELRALYDDAEVGKEMGDLVSAGAGFDDGAELARRSGLGWSRFGIYMRREQLAVHYLTGDWDECERLLATVPELATTLAAAQVVAQGLGVLVARGRAAAPGRLRQLVELAGTDPVLDRDVAVSDAELAIWQGDLERARSATRRGLAAADAVGHFDQALESALVCMHGLAAEADRAEQARAAGDGAALAEATAAGAALLERVRADAERAPQVGLAHDVHVRGRHARAEAEWTRLQGGSDPVRWQAAVDAFSYGNVYAVACCQWRLAEALAGEGRRDEATAAARAAHATAARLEAAPLRSAVQALAGRARLEIGVRLPAQPTLAGLTPRELEVLGLLVEGRSNRQIAEQLFISGKTASVHVTNLLAKLGVHSRLEAAAMARRLGLAQPAGSKPEVPGPAT